MAPTLTCGKCNQIILERADLEVMFYCKDGRNVHIAVKPEREIFVRKNALMVFVNVATINDGGDQKPKIAKTFAKSEDVMCKNCRNFIGAVGPWGPDTHGTSQSIVTFGRDMISLCGVPPIKKTHSKKAPKFPDIVASQVEWHELERRDNQSFFSLVQNEDGNGEMKPCQIVPLVPSVPLVLPQQNNSMGEMVHNFGWFTAGELSVQKDDGSDRNVEHSSSSDLCSITKTVPRNYQVKAFCEVLLRNMIVVMPTGTGKTLLAALLIKKMKMLNPEHMGLFVVDRIPLVFQQADYLQYETGLRVCRVCGENKKIKTLRKLNEGKYDVLVVTAGCLVSMLEREQLDLRLFCTIVVDECHHTTGGHNYMLVLKEVESEGLLTKLGPRILGLTASPVSANTFKAAKTKLENLCAIFGAGILYPDVPFSPTTVEWNEVCRNDQQREYAIWALKWLKKLLDALNRYALTLSEDQNSQLYSYTSKEFVISLETFDKVGNHISEDNLDQVLSAAAVGRLRGQIRAIDICVQDSIDQPALTMIDTLKQSTMLLLASLEASEVMGVGEAHDMLKLGNFYNATDKLPYQEIIVPFIESWKSRLHCFSSVDLEMSPRLKALRRNILQSLHNNNQDSRVLVMVNTRQVAKRLTEYLCKDEATAVFGPQWVVGHGGIDGMTWFDDQKIPIDQFRNGSSRILVATSVLEEGLDVPICDSVIQLQGARSLISFIQSRGRARKEDSKMIVIVSSQERIRLNSIRNQEVEMRVLVKQTAVAQGLPSEPALRVYHLLETQVKSTGSVQLQPLRTDSGRKFSFSGEGLELVVNLWVMQKQSADQCGSCKENFDCISCCSISQEDLELEINKLLLKLDVHNTLILSHVAEMNHTDSMSRIFDKRSCKGFTMNFVLLEELYPGADPCDINELISAFNHLCKQWDFCISSDSNYLTCWVDCKINESEAINSLISQKGIRHIDGNVEFNTSMVAKCSAGRWKSISVFSERHVIQASEINCISFLRGNGIEVSLSIGASNGVIKLCVPQVIMSHFALIAFSESETSEFVRLFIPLHHAPSFIENIDENDTRLTSENSCEDFRHLRPFSDNDVLCIELKEPIEGGHNVASFLKSLECSYLATSVFQTRVKVFNEQYIVESFHQSHGYFPSEQSFLVPQENSGKTFVDGHNEVLPLFTEAYVREVVWLLLSLFSRRLGCFTDAARDGLWRFVSSRIKDLREPIEFASDMNYDNKICCDVPDEVNWIIFALQELCDDIPYWCNVMERFTSAFESMRASSIDDSLHSMEVPGQMITRRLNSAYGSEVCAKRGLPSKRNRFMLYRVVLTPTRVIYLPPIPTLGSRLFRKLGSERFVSVMFRDEQLQKVRGEEVLKLVQSRSANPVTFAGRRNVFLGASSSQIRDQRLLFVNTDSLPSGGSDRNNTITSRLQMLREGIISDKSLTSPSKYLSRLALFFTADIPTVIVEESDVITIKDIQCCETGSVVTDGNGLISFSLARFVSTKHLSLDHTPAAFQIRWRGVKGVVTVVPDDFALLNKHKMAVRPSMIKAVTGLIDDGTLCIVDYSRHHPMHLNREIVTLITSIKEVSDRVSYSLHERLDRCLRQEGEIFCDQELAKARIKEDLTVVQNIYGYEFLEKSFSFDDPLWMDVCQARYQFLIRNYVDKTRIPVSKGCHLIGIADPLGLLRDGEIFVRIVTNTDDFVLEDVDAMVFRNPCLHPGDLRIVSAVNYTELHYFCNVVVFPCKKSVLRNLPAECSGGDLDGDKFYVCWDKEIMPPKHLEHPACPYHRIAADEEKNKCTQVALANFVARCFASDALGRIATAHLAISDIQPNGARDSLAIEVAKAQSLAVDYPKTGVSPLIPEEARKILNEHGLPDFMKSSQGRHYISQKPLGSLYRRAVTFDLNYEYVSEKSNNPKSLYLLPGREKYYKVARICYSRYLSKIIRLKVCFGIKSDAEALLGRALSWHPNIHDFGKAGKAVEHEVRSALLEVRDGFLRICQNLRAEKELVASAFYEIAYIDSSARSFSLAVVDCLQRFVQREGKSNDTTIRERVGISLLNFCKKHVPLIQKWSQEKLSVCKYIKQHLPADESIDVIPFGSVAQGLCGQDSDLDICFQAPRYFDSFPHSDEANGFSSTDKESHFLKNKILPRLDGIVDEVREIFSTAIPILRCSIPSSVDDMDLIQVDMCCNLSGVHKAKWLQSIFLEEPCLYSTMLVLQHWAREAGILRKLKPEWAQRIESNDENLVGICAYDFDCPLLSTGDFHTLILLTLEKQIAHITAKCSTRITSLEDTNNVDPTELCQRSNPKKVADLVLSFFQNVRSLARKSGRENIFYKWPVYTTYSRGEPPIQIISISSLSKIALLGEPARHRLLLGGAESLLNHAQGNLAVVCFTQKLSLSLSLRIDGACAFHATRLGIQFNCKVEIIRVGSSGQLALSAEGFTQDISRLRNEIKYRNQTSSWNFRTPALAHRYIMEGASNIKVYGARSLDLELFFEDIISNNRPNSLASQFRKTFNQQSLCRVVNPDVSMISWNPYDALGEIPPQLKPNEVKLVQSIASIMLQQMSKLPRHFCNGDSGRDYRIRLKVGFGNFVVINVNQSIPETQRTMPLSNLLKGIQKSGKYRKNWLRQDPNPAQEHPKRELKPTRLGKPTRGTQNKRVFRRLRPNINSTFITTFDGEMNDVATTMKQALSSIGYSESETNSYFEEERVNYSLSVLASKGHEVQATFEDGKGKATIVFERPLSWLHFTLLGAGILPDMRIRLDSTTPISGDLIKKAFVGLGDIDADNHPTSPLYWKQHEKLYNGVFPQFLASILPIHRRRVLYIRQRVERSYFNKCQNSRYSSGIPSTARVTIVRDFKRFDGMICLDDPFENAEISLEYQLTSTFFEQPNGIEKLAAQLLSESVELGISLLNAGISVGV